LSGTQRITFTQQFNVENRLVAVTNTVSGQVTQFTYDGDGKRVKKVQSAITTAYVGGHRKLRCEKVSNVVTPTKYYALGGKRVATRNTSGLFYLHGDHLGSSSLTTSNSALSYCAQTQKPQTFHSSVAPDSVVCGVEGCLLRSLPYRIVILPIPPFTVSSTRFVAML
jgi:YD repeat-containing protein